MRQKQAEGTHFLVGLKTLGCSDFERGQKRNLCSKSILRLTLMAAFAKKEAGSASAGGKK